jgi:hypothetical protein
VSQTKTKTRTKAPLLNESESAPLVGPQTEGEWLKATYAAIKRKDASPADRDEFRKALEMHPDLSKDYGELPKMYRTFALEMFQGQPLLEESVKHRLKVMRAELAGPTPSPLELLLVDVVLSTYQDYWHFAMVMKQRTAAWADGQPIEEQALDTITALLERAEAAERAILMYQAEALRALHRAEIAEGRKRPKSAAVVEYTGKICRVCGKPAPPPSGKRLDSLRVVRSSAAGRRHGAATRSPSSAAVLRGSRRRGRVSRAEMRRSPHSALKSRGDTKNSAPDDGVRAESPLALAI